MECHFPLAQWIQFRHGIVDNVAIAMRTSYKSPYIGIIKKKIFKLGALSSPKVRQIYMSLLSILYQTEIGITIYLCEQGSNRTMPFKSKHKVQESSRTLSFRNCSKNRWRGNTILSWSLRYACELKLSKERLFGGNLNGSEPKLNRHCWNDIHEAAAKKPSLLEELNFSFV